MDNKNIKPLSFLEHCTYAVYSFVYFYLLAFLLKDKDLSTNFLFLILIIAYVLFFGSLELFSRFLPDFFEKDFSEDSRKLKFTAIEIVFAIIIGMLLYIALQALYSFSGLNDRIFAFWVLLCGLKHYPYLFKKACSFFKLSRDL